MDKKKLIKRVKMIKSEFDQDETPVPFCLKFFLLFSTLMISADNLLVEQGCFSEAGLLEFMAQSIAVFSAYHSTEQEKEAQMGFIGAIKKAEILSLPKVGTQIFGKVDKQFEAIGIQLAKVEVFNSSQERLAWAEIKTVLSSSK